MIAQAFPYAAVLKYNKILYSEKDKKIKHKNDWWILICSAS